jgi:putative membrane protein
MGVPGLLLALFLLFTLALGIAPHNRADWALENVLVAIAIPVLAWSHRRVPLSNATYCALFVFGLLHEVGAHYTYAEVPYDRWLHGWFGSSPRSWFDLVRNHYDRAIHFLFGLLAAPAAVELVEARAWPRGWWRWLLPVAFVTALATLYELLEWAAATVFAGDLRMAYLGTQGDNWDAQKDILQAIAGSAITVSLMLRHRARRRILPDVDQSSIG